jgi:hypothetical protein
MNKDQITKAGRKTARFPVPSWGFDICIRSWSPKELAEHNQFCQDHKDDTSLDILARVAVVSLCDEQGNLLFTPDDLPLLADKDFTALRLITDEALKLNGLREEDADSFRQPDQE